MSDVEIIGAKVCEGNVQSEWIDVNRHMNVAYYVLAFDLGIDALWTDFGIDDEYIDSGQGSTFGVECHISYLRELHENDHYLITSQLLGYDEKRIHQFQRMYHAGEGFLAATAEWMNLHVNLDTRRVTPWPEPILRRIAAFADTQSGQQRPAEAGRRMSIRKPLYSL
jgi:acyl-CoA thioester hydrolase